MPNSAKASDSKRNDRVRFRVSDEQSIQIFALSGTDPLWERETTERR